MEMKTKSLFHNNVERKSLFHTNLGETPTREGLDFSHEINQALTPIVKRYMYSGFKLRDIETLMIEELHSVFLEQCLNFRDDLAKQILDDANKEKDR